MLRIAHTESSINMGGQEMRVLEQIRWLLENGHAAWLLARENSAVYQEGLKRGLPVEAIPFRGSVNPRAVLSVLDFARREKIDLIDCHSSRDASTVLFSRFFGIPVVRSQHISIKLREDFFHRLMWATGCDHIIVNSESIAERIVKQNLGSRDMIDIIATGIDLERFRPDVDGGPSRKAFGVPSDAKLISTIGMIRPDKAQRFLIRAVDRIVEKIPKAYFFVVGSPTRPEFLDQLRAEIDLIQNKDRVILTGFQGKVENFVAASDLIVITSEIEGQSQVVPQAFAMKKPVVASNVGGIPENVRHGKTGFLYEFGNAERLAELAVEALSSDISAITEEAYKVAQKKFGLEAMMDATLRCYEKVLGA